MLHMIDLQGQNVIGKQGQVEIEPCQFFLLEKFLFYRVIFGYNSVLTLRRCAAINTQK